MKLDIKKLPELPKKLPDIKKMPQDPTLLVEIYKKCLEEFISYLKVKEEEETKRKAIEETIKFIREFMDKIDKNYENIREYKIQERQALLNELLTLFRKLAEENKYQELLTLIPQLLAFLKLPIVSKEELLNPYTAVNALPEEIEL